MTRSSRNLLKVLILPIVIWAATISVSAVAQEDPIDQGLTGPALARALGLDPVTDNVVFGCTYFVEAGDLGYCVDSMVKDGYDAWRLYVLLNGGPFTATEERIFWIQDEIRRLAADPAFVNETNPAIPQRIRELEAELQSYCGVTEYYTC